MAGGHVLLRGGGGVRGRGVCMVGACVAGGWWGCAWQGACVAGGRAWQILGDTVNERAVRILRPLPCILVKYMRIEFQKKEQNYINMNVSSNPRKNIKE